MLNCRSGYEEGKCAALQLLCGALRHSRIVLHVQLGFIIVIY